MAYGLYTPREATRLNAWGQRIGACAIFRSVQLLRISSVLGGSCRLGEVRRSFDLGVSAFSLTLLE